MYPLNLLALHPPFPRTHRVFVAMSFDRSFDTRWRDVLIPACRAVSYLGEPLEPYRVDVSMVSEAVVSEIVREIAGARLVIADLTCMHVLNGKAMRNANVMYEVGLAHATRLPEEVILLRSDREQLDFDVAGVRVSSYDPDGNPQGAIEMVKALIQNALNAVELSLHMSVERACQRLTAPAVDLLLALASAGPNGYAHFFPKTYGDVLRAAAEEQTIRLLLDVGALRTVYDRCSDDGDRRVVESGSLGSLATYHCTPLGIAMAQSIEERIGVSMRALDEPSFPPNLPAT